MAKHKIPRFTTRAQGAWATEKFEVHVPRDMAEVVAARQGITAGEAARKIFDAIHSEIWMRLSHHTLGLDDEGKLHAVHTDDIEAASDDGWTQLNTDQRRKKQADPSFLDIVILSRG